MKKYFVLPGVAVVFLISLASCSGGTPPSPTSTPLPPTELPELTATPEPTPTPIVYEMSITFIDEEGGPIPNVRVTLDEMDVFADDQGILHTPILVEDFNITVWAQGFLPETMNGSLQPGENQIEVVLVTDPFGLQLADLEMEGYELVYVEDFQDGISSCLIDGNGTVFQDEVDPGNWVMLVDLRGLDSGLNCYFGPINTKDAIIEVEFRYPEIRYDDYSELEGYYHWQGYAINYRDGMSVSGHPLQVYDGATLQIIDYSQDEWKFPVQVRQNIQENRWYQYRVSYEGNKIMVFMDESLRFTFLTPPSLINTDQASISAFGQAYIQFDNIKMWMPSE